MGEQDTYRSLTTDNMVAGASQGTSAPERDPTVGMNPQQLMAFRAAYVNKAWQVITRQMCITPEGFAKNFKNIHGTTFNEKYLGQPMLNFLQSCGFSQVDFNGKIVYYPLQIYNQFNQMVYTYRRYQDWFMVIRAMTKCNDYQPAQQWLSKQLMYYL